MNAARLLCCSIAERRRGRQRARLLRWMDELSHIYIKRIDQRELGTLDFSARVRAGVDVNPGEGLDAAQD